MVAVAAFAASVAAVPVASHLALDQIGCQRGEPVVLILSEAIVDRDIWRLYKTPVRRTGAG
jgi:hypothetical protein